MKRQMKLTPQEQSQQHTAAEQEQTVREFASADEMLRDDAAHTVVPPAVAERLRESAAGIPAPGRSWWKRLFKTD